MGSDATTTTRQPGQRCTSIAAQCRDRLQKAPRHHHRRLDVGPVHAPRSFARSAGTATCTSARASSWSAAAPASPRIRNCWRRWRRAAPAPAISASKSPKRIAIDRAGPHHRRAAAAANPDLVGPPATAAARHHRPGALPSRLGVRARRAGRQRRARSFQRRPRRGRRHPDRRRRHPLHRARPGRAGTAADLRRLLHLARRAERSRPRAEER